MNLFISIICESFRQVLMGIKSEKVQIEMIDILRFIGIEYGKSENPEEKVSYVKNFDVVDEKCDRLLKVVAKVKSNIVFFFFN